MEYKGKTYKLVPEHEDNPCNGCAFIRNAAGCRAQDDKCIEKDSIWVEDVQTRDEPAPPSAAQAASKPSNPKDLVGIRKAPLSTLPMNVVAEMGLGMMDGALKYGRHNFRAVGVRSSVYFDAAQRHLIAWWEGEDEDPDTCERDADDRPIPGSGVHHITKLLTCLAVLRDAQLQGLAEDDRPPRARRFYEGLNARAGKLLDLHAGKNPRHYTIKDTLPDSGIAT